jgi:hypothetical protein
MTSIIDSVSSKQRLFLSTSLPISPKLNKKRLGMIMKNKIRLDTLRSQGYHTGKWTQEEHIQFLHACLKHGNNWTRVILFNSG